MPRLARVAIAGIPHHVTPRGSRRRRTFFSDQDYEAYRELCNCGRYVELDPLRARLVRRPEDWPYSSDHLTGRDDTLVSVAPLLDVVAGSIGPLPQ
jgi:hypothetical protein